MLTITRTFAFPPFHWGRFGQKIYKIGIWRESESPILIVFIQINIDLVSYQRTSARLLPCA